MKADEISIDAES